MLPPMVKVSIRWRIRCATWALAPWLVTKIVVTIVVGNQRGAPKSMKTYATTFTTIPKTMDMFSVKNGIWLTINAWEQTGWIIVDAGFMIQAQISQVTIARAVIPTEKKRSIAVNLAILSSTSARPPVKKYILLKRAPGSMICANTKNNPS